MGEWEGKGCSGLVLSQGCTSDKKAETKRFLRVTLIITILDIRSYKK